MSLEIKQLICHHSDDSVSKIDKNHTKAEILQCLKANAWTFSSKSSRCDDLEKELSNKQSDLMISKRLIMSFMKKPLVEKDGQYSEKDLVKETDMVVLVGQLLRMISDKGESK